MYQRCGLGGALGWSLKPTRTYLFSVQEAHKTSSSFIYGSC